MIQFFASCFWTCGADSVSWTLACGLKRRFGVKSSEVPRLVAATVIVSWTLLVCRAQGSFQKPTPYDEMPIAQIAFAGTTSWLAPKFSVTPTDGSTATLYVPGCDMSGADGALWPGPR